jgi:hypothetical protein
MKRLMLVGLLALGIAACEPGEEFTSPVPGESGAPLYNQGADPEETQPELGDDEP